ncbi:MAG: glycosyltransferase family 4 protein [Flavicella sp.]
MILGFDAKRAFHNTTGLGNYSRDLISGLQKFFPDNTYYLYNPKKKKVDRLQLHGTTKEVLPNGFIWKKLSSIWRLGPINQQLHEDKVTLFHGLSGEIPKGLKKKGIKSVVTIHDLIFLSHPELYRAIDRKIYYKKALFAAKNADIIIAISEETKRQVVRYLNVPASKIRVVYQTCHDLFKSQLADEFKEKVLKKYKLPSTFILNVGTIEPRKNLLSLVQSIKDMDVPLVAVGRKTDYYEQVEKYIAEHGMEDRVYFLEGLDLKELAALYQCATVFVYPSFVEGFGIPIIEALYSGTPVITSKEGVFPEAGGENSLYIAPDNPDSIKEALQQVLQSKGVQKKMAVEGLNYVQRFSVQTITQNLMNIYSEVHNNKQ